MECNKEEARRAMDIAEMKLCEKDYSGAKKFINKAQNLYPTLDGLKQVLMMIDVYISASNKNNGGGESDWYGILGVHPSADDETLKKQYKNLARSLHPDKNRSHGAECAFKLVLDAWSLLSDKAKRIAYDQKRKPIQVQQEPQDEPEPASSSSKPPEKATVSTVCNRCATRYAPFLSNKHINQTFPCPNCGQDSAISTEMINGTLYVRFSYPLQKEEQSSANSQATRHTSSSSSTSAASETTQGRGKRFFEEYSREKLAATTARGNSNEAEKLLKKLMTTTRHANSTDEARRLFKNPTKTTADANSTDEAKRLFKKP